MKELNAMANFAEWFGELGRRLRMLVFWRQFDRDLEEEMQLHRELKEQELRQLGVAPAEAHYMVQRRFGNSLRLREESADEWGHNWLDRSLQDLRYAVRQLRKSPGFTTVAILTLAIGIGANAAIFSVINTVLLRPLPYHAPEQLVKVWPDKALSSVSKAQYVAIRGQMRSLSELAAYTTFTFTLTGDGDPEELKGGLVSANCLSLLGIRPLLGRTLLSGEDEPGRDHVLLLSHGLWQRRFGGDADVIGRTVTLDGEPYTVIGVMPASLAFPDENLQLWVPMTINPAHEQDFTAGYLNLLGRLTSSATTDQAQAELFTLAQQLRHNLPGLEPSYGSDAAVNPLQQELVGDVRPRLLLLLGVVVLVLLIACANVANLQLSRTSGRSKEIAIRATNGATRGRLIRQLGTESLLLALLGGAAGLALAVAAERILIASLPVVTPRLNEICIDFRVFGFALGCSVLTGLIFGLVPAIRLSKPDLLSALKESSRTAVSGFRGLYRRALVVTEVALALMVLVGAGLLGKSLWRLATVDPGFRPENVLTLRLAPPEAHYDTPARKVNFYREVLQRVDGLPGVVSSGAINLLPLSGRNWNFTFSVEGRRDLPGTPSPRADFRLVSGEYFATLGTQLKRGRSFSPLDSETAPKVAVINQTMARKYWPHDDPLGKRISNKEDDWATIVGVVEDVKDNHLDQGARPELYRPYNQVPWISGLTVMVRTNSDPAALASSIRDVVRSIDRDVPVSDVQSLTEVVSRSISAPRSTTLMIATFAMVAMLLGVLGIYGVISYSVARRVHEIGIRMALGATRGDILQQVVREGALLTLLGIALGIAGSFGLTRLIASLLYQVRPTDAATFILSSLVLGSVAIVASYLPARRATSVDPVVALRYE
jgi:putative ABC transport system permease protein